MIFILLIKKRCKIPERVHASDFYFRKCSLKQNKDITGQGAWSDVAATAAAGVAGRQTSQSESGPCSAAPTQVVTVFQFRVSESPVCHTSAASLSQDVGSRNKEHRKTLTAGVTMPSHRLEHWEARPVGLPEALATILGSLSDESSVAADAMPPHYRD